MIETTAALTMIKDLGEGYWYIEADCPVLAKQSKPGHFVNIKTGDYIQPLLRRPLALLDVEGSHIKFFMKVIGNGTKWLSTRKQGETLNIVGPLGEGLFEAPSAQRIILVAGGVGLAPLYFYLAYNRNQSAEKIVFYGAQSAHKIFFQNELLNLSHKCIFVTEDGTLGEKGLVTEELKRYFLETGPRPGDVIMACGPKFMLKEVVIFAEAEGIPCQVSLESYMGCGAGVCLSCVIPSAEYKNDGQAYFKLCTDGPVVDIKKIDKKFFEESYGHC